MFNITDMKELCYILGKYNNILYSLSPTLIEALEKDVKPVFRAERKKAIHQLTSIFIFIMKIYHPYRCFTSTSEF